MSIPRHPLLPFPPSFLTLVNLALLMKGYEVVMRASGRSSGLLERELSSNFPSCGSPISPRVFTLSPKPRVSRMKRDGTCLLHLPPYSHFHLLFLPLTLIASHCQGTLVHVHFSFPTVLPLYSLQSTTIIPGPSARDRCCSHSTTTIGKPMRVLV